MADTARSATALKALFETGDIPTQQNFADWITSYQNIVDNNLLTGISATVTAVTPPVQGTATALTTLVNIVTSIPSANAGVKLPVGASGMLCVVASRATGALSVFPTTGQNHYGLSANTSFNVPTNNTAVFQYIAGSGWVLIGGTFYDQTQGGLYTFEAQFNKSSNTLLGTSDTLYPTQNAVKEYTDNAVGGLHTTAVLLISQTGTGNPTAVTLFNNTGRTFSFLRDSAGVYEMTPSSFPSLAKTFVVQGNATPDANFVSFTTDTGDVFWALNTYTTGGTNSDDILNRFCLEIRIYP